MSYNRPKMNLNTYSFLVIISVFFCYACETKPESFSVEVKNTLSIARNFETVEINLTDLSGLDAKKAQTFKVVDLSSNKTMISQAVDTNVDGEIDVILFQPELKANETRVYSITVSASHTEKDSAMIRCYSRFVPERTDDYAWENNRVAFRTYGPTAQKMVEDGIKGGTLSSGMDAWLKRVDYPIINKWYDKTVTGEGTYHEDTGEGLDNFHVGISRGVGGIAIKTDTTYAISKNFSSYKTITTGPIRTSFILDYETWDANGVQINESKLISLDYGQNLTKFEITLDGKDTLSAGLTLHKKDGIINTNINEGWISYWEPFDDSELGQGLVAPKASFTAVEEYLTSRKDESNLYAHLKVAENKVIYYAGFGWKKSNQFDSKEAWDTYLSDFAKKINNPLVLSFE